MNWKDRHDRIWRHLRRMERREFLRMAAGSALAASGMLGCAAGSTGPDDDGDGNGDGNGNGNNSGVTPAQRSASIQATLDRINAIANQPRDTRMAMMLDYVKSRPEIIGSGSNADGVWAIYPDGTPLMILDNRQPEDEPPPDELPPLTPALSGTEVPSSTRARFINTMGSAFPNVNARFTPLVSANGYSILSTDPGTIDTLPSAGGDGIFHMSSHGGVVVIPDLVGGKVQVDAQGNATGLFSRYGIWTASPYLPEMPNQYRGHIAAGEVGIGIARYNVVIAGIVHEFAAHYFITSRFVRQWMNDFGENSLVWFSACSSNSTDSADFVAACLAKKAGLYVGWSNPTHAGAVTVTGRFILDRLLGSNTTNPKENPPQRPFDYEEVWADLREHGLHRHLANPTDPSDLRTTEIVYSPNPTDFGLLAPSLGIVEVSENRGQAILTGIFGDPPPSERAVLIGGLEATVVSWDEYEIVCALPPSGPGSAGDVVVWVRGHKSNIRRITEWNVPMRFSFRKPDQPPLKVDGPIVLRFRADVGGVRAETHEDPTELIRGAVATRDSGASLTASGTRVHDGCTTTWLGQQDFPAVGFSTIINALDARFRVDPETKTGAIGLALQGGFPPPFTVRQVCGSDVTEVPFMVGLGVLFGESSFPNPLLDLAPAPLPAIELEFGNDFRFPGGAFEDITEGVTRLEWDAVVPSFPPDPDAARVAGIDP